MLISGGNGFLGSHLVDKAISEGFNVTVIDDFSTYEKL
jgi:UDP-glucose 4-epimerase